MRRSDVIWVVPEGARRAFPLWHLWHGGTAYVVTGGLEQQLPTCAQAEVVVRRKERPAERAGSWQAAIAPVEPGSALWAEVTPLLQERRLNAVDAEGQALRWAQESVVLALRPVD